MNTKHSETYDCLSTEVWVFYSITTAPKTAAPFVNGAHKYQYSLVFRLINKLSLISQEVFLFILKITYNSLIIKKLNYIVHIF